MRLKQLYYNLSIKYKILVFFFGVIFIVSIMLGTYAYVASQRYITSRVSIANLGVVKQINSNIDFLQKDLFDISTYLCLDSGVQSFLLQNNNDAVGQTYDKNAGPTDPLVFLSKLIATKSYISCIMLYDNNGLPVYFTTNDLSTGEKPISSPEERKIYNSAKSLNGNPVWFHIQVGNQAFIQKNLYPKIIMGRIVKDISSLREIGFLTLGVNEQTIKSMYMNNIQSNLESIIILDKNGDVISAHGAAYYDRNQEKQQNLYLTEAQKNVEGYLIDRINGKEMLVTYSSKNLTGWKVIYIVPLNIMTREINSIKVFTLFIILICILISSPLVILTSSFLTAPIKKLLKSMKNFQEGNFDESIEFKYTDEIGMLGQGYNNMVANIKELIENNYILKIEEREAELNALQAQINPHFLYNTLETIYCEAENAGQNNIGEMVICLSRLFRLSLNRGKSFTLVSKEKELVEYYLILQKTRYKNKLEYVIKIDDKILNYVIPKLILQPFVENAILHGIDKKLEPGLLEITGTLKEGKILFTIKDNGIGMDEDTINNLLVDRDNNDINTSRNPGGYAVRNIAERLRLYFKDNHSLKFTSSPAVGTTVEITIPAVESGEDA